MKKRGIIMLELMVILLVMSILGTASLGKLTRMKKRAMEVMVIQNMHVMQLAAEDFATLSEGIYAADCAQTVTAAVPVGVSIIDPHYIGGNVSGLLPDPPDNLLPLTFNNPVIAGNNSYWSPSVANQPAWCWVACNAGGVAYNPFDASGCPVANGSSPSPAVRYEIYGQGIECTLQLSLTSDQ